MGLTWLARGMHDDVRMLGQRDRDALVEILLSWNEKRVTSRGDWLSNAAVSEVVTALAGLVYDDARATGATNDEAWERMQEVIVGVGMGDLEEKLEDARNE